MSYTAGGRATQSGRATVVFAAAQSATLAVTFPVPYPAGSTPNVTVNHVGSGAMGANPDAITNTGFTISAFYNPGALTGTFPFTWISHGPGPA